MKMNFFKRHKCPKCGKKFGQQEELMHHEQIAHDDTMYDCKKCNLYFSSMEEMRTHLQRAHKYQGRPNNQ